MAATFANLLGLVGLIIMGSPFAATAPSWLFGGEWMPAVSFGSFERHPSGRWKSVVEDPVFALEDLLGFIPEDLLRENITFVGLYSSLTVGNLDGLIGAAAATFVSAFSHHEFVVMDTTSGRGASVEKLDDGLVVQISDDPEKLVEWQLSYRRKCVRGLKEGRPHAALTLGDFLRLLYAAGEPSRVYHLIDENCTDFVARVVVEYFRSPELYPDFDELLRDFKTTCHLQRSLFG